MELDLAFSLACLSLGALIAFCLMAYVCAGASLRKCQCAAIVVVLAGTAYGFLGWDQVWLSRFIPSSALIVWGNWFGLFAAALAGVVVRVSSIPGWRRGIAAAGVMGAGVYSTVFPVIGTAPECLNRWQGSICLQSTAFTCSAASAATLLRAHGIETTEQEMAQLCLTGYGRKGTSWQGLFRGLSLKTAGSPWKVEIFETESTQLDELQARPALLVACLPDDKKVDPFYHEDGGWIPGQTHAVVCLEMRGSHLGVMGDPRVGRELWSQPDFRVLWTGLGFRLVPRDPSAVLPPVRRTLPRSYQQTLTQVTRN